MQETVVQSMPGSGRFSREGKCNPLQHYCLGNPMDRGAWQAIVHGITKESDMTEVTEQQQLLAGNGGLSAHPECESVHVLLGQVAMLVCSWYAHL